MFFLRLSIWREHQRDERPDGWVLSEWEPKMQGAHALVNFAILVIEHYKDDAVQLVRVDQRVRPGKAWS